MNTVFIAAGCILVIVAAIFMRLKLKKRNDLIEETRPAATSSSTASTTINSSGNADFASFLSGLSYITLFAGIIGCIIVLVTATWVKVDIGYYPKTVFSPTGLGIAVGLLFSSLIFFGVLGGISRILKK